MTAPNGPRIQTALAVCHLVVAVLLVGLLLGLHRPLLGIGTSKTYVRADRAMEKALEESVAGTWLLTPVHTLTRLIAPMLLIASGVALLRGKNGGRLLALAYAALSLLDNIWYGGALYAVYWGDGPALSAAMEAERLGGSSIAEVVQVQTPAVALGILYPVFVLIILATTRRRTR